jgi:hypothetical protein
MLRISFDVLVALVLYFTPGYLLLWWIDFPSLRGINRWLVALCISLVIVPFAFISVGNLMHIQVTLWVWLILVAVLSLGAWLLKRTHRRLPVHFIANGSAEPAHSASRVEIWGVIIFLALFAAVVNLPRLLMFFQGSYVMELAPYDETWHIEQLIAVARTGIPPSHYFFPSIHLSYYYGSWIYPALLGNLPVSPVSLMRAMAIHSYVQVFAFLSLVYVILLANIRRPWVRLVGICFFSVMGGFDLFAKLPGVDNIEFWIRDPSWLMNGTLNMQISQFLTLYMWVPHHVAAGMVTLLLALLYKNLDMPIRLKLACTGVLLGFCITTSPFVFMGLAIAALIVFIFNLGKIWQNRSIVLPGLALAGFLFLLVAWQPLRLYSLHSSTLTYNAFQINLVERFRGNTELNAIIDKTLTMLGLPLVAGALLVINMGLMFILYVVWWIRHLITEKSILNSSQNLILGLQPLASVIFVFLVTDRGGGTNVTMRGMISAQILITLAAILALDWLADRTFVTRAKRIIFSYLLVCFIFAQSLSSLAELRTNSKRVVELALWNNCGVPAIVKGTFDPDYCLIKDQWRYVYWLNTQTPINALLLEDGPYGVDYIKFRWLERQRLLIPPQANGMELFYYDQDFILPREWTQLNQQGDPSMDVLDWYHQLDIPAKGHQPVYLVTRLDSEIPPGAGDPVYQDSYVKIFSLPDALLNP